MAKLLLILFIGLVFESTGIVLLKRGITQIGGVQTVTTSEVLHAFKTGITNTQVLLGIFFEALFFVCLLLLMSKSDISFLWPLTALSFVFATLAARMFLAEQVSPIRWAGVLLIMIGAGLISYSEHAKPQATLTARTQGPNPARWDGRGD
jgi:drug/metabolite transporter (DMT)-like permease